MVLNGKEQKVCTVNIKNPIINILVPRTYGKLGLQTLSLQTEGEKNEPLVTRELLNAQIDARTMFSLHHHIPVNQLIISVYCI